MGRMGRKHGRLVKFYIFKKKKIIRGSVMQKTFFFFSSIIHNTQIYTVTHEDAKGQDTCLCS